MPYRFTYTLLISLTALTLACSNPDNKATSDTITSASDLAGKTFSVAFAGLGSKEMKDAEVTMIFKQDTMGAIRMKEGSTFNQLNFSWRFIGDSLRLQHPGPNVENDRQYKTKPLQPEMYIFTKEPGGYMLTGRKEQMLLTTQK